MVYIIRVLLFRRIWWTAIWPWTTTTDTVFPFLWVLLLHLLAFHFIILFLHFNITALILSFRAIINCKSFRFTTLATKSSIECWDSGWHLLILSNLRFSPHYYKLKNIFKWCSFFSWTNAFISGVKLRWIFGISLISAILHQDEYPTFLPGIRSVMISFP